MPRGDGTGPAGMGPMTGRGAGYCTGYGMPGFMSGYGWGFRGRGRGGYGFRNRFYATGLPGWQRWADRWPAWGTPSMSYAPYGTEAAAPVTGEAELTALKDQAQYLEGMLTDLRKRIEELEALK